MQKQLIVSVAVLVSWATLHATNLTVGMQNKRLTVKGSSSLRLEDTPARVSFLQFHTERGGGVDQGLYLANVVNLGLVSRLPLGNGLVGGNVFYDLGWERVSDVWLNMHRLGLGFDYLVSTSTARLNTYWPVAHQEKIIAGDHYKALKGMDVSIDYQWPKSPLGLNLGLATWKTLGTEGFGEVRYQWSCSYMKSANAGFRYGLGERFRSEKGGKTWSMGMVLQLFKPAHCHDLSTESVVQDRRFELVDRDFRLKVLKTNQTKTVVNSRVTIEVTLTGEEGEDDD